MKSFPLFNNKPLKTEKEVEQYMNELGLLNYGRYVEVVIDTANIDITQLNKQHPLYDKIVKVQEENHKEWGDFVSFRI